MTEPLRPPKTTAHLEQLQALVKDARFAPPIATLLGLRLEAIELGRSSFRMQADRRFANPMGTLHGGILCDMGDAAMGTAMATTLEDDESFTTIDLSCKFFKPVWEGELRATARMVKRTRKLGLLVCEIEDEKGSLVAHLDSTCLVLRGDEAKGR